MSKYGLKIKNYQAGSIYGYDLGIRDNYDFTDAMLTNSLFSDFIIDNGLNVWKEKSTRDIICLEFDYGTKSYEKEVSSIKAKIRKLRKEQFKNKQHIVIEDDYYDSIFDDDTDDIIRYKKALSFVYQRRDKFKEMNANKIREEYYVNGVSIEYKTFNKKGIITDIETIHYKMLYRTPGKAKKGTCMFINEKLYDVARNFLYMGIKLPYYNAPIVEIGAYSSLITSSIVGRIHIDPDEILVINDIDSFMTTNVISIETDEDRHCDAISINDYKLKNTLFDGQALIDSSIFPDWGNGYILLRHHFCKMAAFNSNIQLFFKDYFKDRYDTATVKDMFGNEHLAKNIKLITTDNALKWLKFEGIDYEYWSKWVRANNSLFGIVKTAHESKLGNVQRMSYQMNNALDVDIMDSVLKCSTDYVYKLKTDDEAFLNYLKDNYNFSNDYEVLVALCNQDRDFLRSEYFRDRKRKIIETYVLNLKNGHTIQENADNLVIVGSPYAMLLHSVGEDVNKDNTFNVEDDCIQCYAERFNDGEYLAEFRSPFNSKNNMGYLHNHYDDRLKRYFNFGKQIIAINMIGTCFQDRNNGSDQDSDSIYTTNHPAIVECARKCYLDYPTIVNNIPKEKNHYNNELLEYAKIDNNLAAAQLAIGESSNLAQVCLTYTYNFKDEKYKKYVCILSVLAQCAIDNAKRKFDIDLTEEISRIKKDMDIEVNKYPKFWNVIRKDFNKTAENILKDYMLIKENKLITNPMKENLITKDKEMRRYLERYDSKNKINTDLVCPMNSIFDLKFDRFRSELTTLPMDTFFVKYELDEHRRKSMKVEELIQKFSLNLFITNTNDKDLDDTYNDYLLLRSDFDDLINEIKTTYISKNYLGLMSWLINRAFYIGSGIKGKKNITNSTINTNRSLLLKILYTINPDSFLKCFSKNINEKNWTTNSTDYQKTL